MDSLKIEENDKKKSEFDKKKKKISINFILLPGLLVNNNVIIDI